MSGIVRCNPQVNFIHTSWLCVTRNKHFHASSCKTCWNSAGSNQNAFSIKMLGRTTLRDVMVGFPHKWRHVVLDFPGLPTFAIMLFCLFSFWLIYGYLCFSFIEFIIRQAVRLHHVYSQKCHVQQLENLFNVYSAFLRRSPPDYYLLTSLLNTISLVAIFSVGIPKRAHDVPIYPR